MLKKECYGVLNEESDFRVKIITSRKTVKCSSFIKISFKNLAINFLGKNIYDAYNYLRNH